MQDVAMYLQGIVRARITRRNRVRVALVCVLALTLGIGSHVALASANVQRIAAVVRCAHPAEDSLAHVRMVRYDPTHDVLVYACKRVGY
jgi:hypothetical protein